MTSGNAGHLDAAGRGADQLYLTPLVSIPAPKEQKRCGVVTGERE